MAKSKTERIKIMQNLNQIPKWEMETKTSPDKNPRKEENIFSLLSLFKKHQKNINKVLCMFLIVLVSLCSTGCSVKDIVPENMQHLLPGYKGHEEATTEDKYHINKSGWTEGQQFAYNEIIERIEVTPFSRADLRETILYLGGCNEEEIDSVLDTLEREGVINWKEQAVETAKMMLENDKYTKEEMRIQLINGGMYTDGEADYAVNEVYGK